MRLTGEEVKGFSNKHGARKTTPVLKEQAGESHVLEVDYEFLRSDALLKFDLGFKEDVAVQQSVEKVIDDDIVIFVGGISPSLEGEEMGVNLPGFMRGDRTEIELPEVQRELIAALYEAGKKIVLVNCSGSPIALIPETQRCEAILQAWYPGQAGGQAVADVLFGTYNPAGRLPMTFYSCLAQVPDFEDYNMTGRTYRYLQEEPLWPFGYGLSYTTFSYDKARLNKPEVGKDKSLTLSVNVTNTGASDGDEVIQVYLKKEGDAEGALKTLRAFKRVNIPAGKTMQVAFKLGEKELEWWDEQSNVVRMTPGDYTLMVGSSSKEIDLQELPFKVL